MGEKNLKEICGKLLTLSKWHDIISKLSARDRYKIEYHLFL